MIKKEKKYYSDLYDKITIRQCRMLENVGKKVISKPNASDNDQDFTKGLPKMISDIGIYWYCAKRSKEKEITVLEWLEEDER